MNREELRGWLTAGNLNIDCLGECEDLGDGVVQYSNLLHKFPKDEIFLCEEGHVCFLTGYVYNKQDFLQRGSTQEETSREWAESFAASLKQDTKAHFQKLRGAFCGYVYDKDQKETLIYTDHTSNKAVYYYVDGDKWIVSNYVDYIVRVLRANGIT